MNSKHVIVVGAGPGGYAAAMSAAERGFSVTLIEREATGGTCLNRGCIPSKFLLARSHEKNPNELSLAGHLVRKETILSTLRQRMDQGAKALRIQRVYGTARFLSPHTFDIKTSEGASQRISGDVIILATGTQPVTPAFFPRHAAIHDSTSILSLDRLPEKLVVIGGGYIGSELACAFHGLGSHVTLIEKEPSLLATQPEFAAAAGVLQRSFQKRGMTVWTGTEVTAIHPIDDKYLSLTCSNGSTLQADAVLLALGRRPDFETLDLHAAGLSFTNQRLMVNAHGQTEVPHIYAIGDLVSPLPLAHTAEKEASIAVAHLSGEPVDPIDYSRIPRCIYTWPEIAAVGWTEVQAKAAGHSTRVDRYHLAASAKAMVEGEPEGFWAIVSDTDTGKILGAAIVGLHATELIHLIALSLKAGFTTTDIAETVFAHPSLSESFREVMKRSLQKPTGVA